MYRKKIMDVEEFGYTKRNEKALQRARALEDNAMNEEQEHRVVNIHPKHHPKGEFDCQGTEGVAEGGTTSTETGSNRVNTLRQRWAQSSVVHDTPNTPNIPNVVEYHPKVSQISHKKLLVDSLKEDRRNMRTDQLTLSNVHDDKKNLVSQLSRLSIDNNVFEGSSELPQVFQVKYLGSHDARGLWGIKHTRKPVDNMVAAAKSLPTGSILPLMKLVVSNDGVALVPIGQRKSTTNGNIYPIETISYGVQDLVYTRVFTMIVVRDTVNFRRVSPFECHGFVCESKHHARQMVYALAAAFQTYSQNVKAHSKTTENVRGNIKKRFAIDLRTPEEIETDLTLDSEA